MTRFLFALLPTLFFVSCSTSATISTHDGKSIEAVISHADAETVFVETKFSGPISRVPKVQILDIDHPGNVHLLVGSILTAFGLFQGAVAIWAYSERVNDPYNEIIAVNFGFQSVVYLAVGIPLGLWGFKTWTGSKARLENGLEKIRITVRPDVSTGHLSPTVNLALDF